jgi:predicted N-acetyltransferase YhbS
VTPIAVHRTGPEDQDQVRGFYRRAGYVGEALIEDRVFVAVEQEVWVGIVRLVVEHRVTVLRGMRVLGTHQRRGVGRELLRVTCQALDDQPCYCLPFAHLTGFYGQAGFREIDAADAPPFLAERLADYRRRRPDRFTLMRRG